MQLIRDSISLAALTNMATNMAGNLVKAVVDVEQEIMVVDAGMHADEEYFLLEHGSDQNNLWGINLHPAHYGNDKFIEFASMINLRPSWGNKTRSVDNPLMQKKIRVIVQKLVTP